MTLEGLKEAIYVDNGLSATKLIYDYLMEEIVQLRIAPEMTISEVKYSSALNISRSPIRAALDRLEDDGLITREKGKQAIVTPLSQAEYYAMSELRMAVEGQAAYSLAYTISDRGILELKALLEPLNKPGKTALPYPLNDTKFHEYIIRATQNTFLIDAYEIYRAKLLRYRNFAYKHLQLDPYGRRMRSGIHKALFYAISHHDADAARRAAVDDAVLMRLSTNLFP